MNRESKAFKRAASALEALFMALAALYLAYRTSRITTFHLVWPARFEEILMVALAALAAARLVAAGTLNARTLAALALAAVYGLVYRNSGYRFLLFLAIFTVGFTDIDYKRILKVYLLAAGLFYAVTLIAGMTGLITNFVTARAGRGIRSAWGMSYYTDFASFGLFLLMALWVAARKLPDWATLIFCAGFLLLSAFIAHSNTSTICAGLMMLAILWHAFERRVVARRDGLRWMKRGPELFATFGFPLLALCMFFLMLLYARKLNIGYRLNSLLSNRLMRGVAAWKNYGVKPFGTPFEQHGNGFSTFPSNTYNFVDSTYALVLLRYGWVTLLALCLSWGYTARRACRCGDRRLLLVMGIIAVHAFSEHHFTECHFNILVAMPFAAYAPPDARAPEAAKPSRDANRTALAWTLTALLLAAGAYCLGPTLLIRLKTALELMHYGHGEHNLRLICVLGAALLGLCLLAWSVCGIIRAALNGTGLRACRRALAALALCAVMGGGAWLLAGRVVARLGAEYDAAVEADRRALEIAVSAAEGRVRSGVLPEVYSRRIGGLSRAAYFEDDLSRLRGDTVLLPSDEARGPFLDNGFLYVPISDSHALYTGDRAVAEALSEAGYRVTGYFSTAREVDLALAAELNALSYDPASGVALTGLQSRMDQGPWQDLYGGRYTVTWQLALPEQEASAKTVVCKLRVTTYRGDEVILEKSVRAGKFDDGGLATVSANFNITDSRDVAFEVQSMNGATVEVRQIRFQRSPYYDVHTFYDSRLRKVRDEYYGTDGQPILQKGGWFACDYGYDRHGNVASVRYYDREGEPVMISGGYAEERRVYNAQRQVVREEYRDWDGELVVCKQGYAADEREYDGAGNIVVQRYYGTDGGLLIARAGYAEVRREYDRNKQVVLERYYGVNGEPVALKEGYWGLERAYDAAGNVTMRRYIGADGAPLALGEGYAEVRRVYDGQHQVVREAFYGVRGEPVLLDEGYASNEREYDDAGNVTVQRYYGLDGAPAIIAEGYARIDREYNAQGQVVRESYFGIDDEPVPMKRGQCGEVMEYDEAGNVSMRRYLDADGQPMLTDKGYAEYRRVYNRRRKVVRESYYGADGAPVALPDGYAAVEYDYDEAGNVTAQRYFGTDGKPVIVKKGYAGIGTEYNAERRVVRRAYYGTDGQLINIRRKQYAVVEYEYDAAGKQTAKRYYDRDGTLVDEVIPK